jgi:hypothetical protein
VSLRLATAYFRTGHVHEAREVFSRMLECPTIGRFCDVAAAQIEAGDLDGALQTARSMEALMTSPLIEAGDWGGLPVNLAVALAAREGPDAGLALLQNLPIDGTLFADGLVALAEQAVTVGLRPVARALLASALSTRASLTWVTSTGEESIGNIARMLARKARAVEAREVLGLLPEGQARQEALPSVAAALVHDDRIEAAVELIDSADQNSRRDHVRAAVATSLESRGRHREAMTEVARIDRPHTTLIANDALTRMGRTAAQHRRYDDAWECLTHLRQVSSVDDDREGILAAIAIAYCTDDDLDSAGRMIEQLRTDWVLSECLAEMARVVPTVSGLDTVRRWAMSRVPPIRRLAPLAAVTAAGRRLGQPDDGVGLSDAARSAIASLHPGDVFAWAVREDCHCFGKLAAELAIALDEAGRDDAARLVRETVLWLPEKSEVGFPERNWTLRSICVTYARAGRPDVAWWALSAITNDTDRADAVRWLVSEAPSEEFTDLLVRLALSGRRNRVPYLARAFAETGNWEQLTSLLLASAETPSDACHMCATLAAFSPPDGVQLARHINTVFLGEARPDIERGA